MAECVNLMEESDLIVIDNEWKHYKSFKDRVETGAEKSMLGQLPRPLDTLTV